MADAPSSLEKLEAIQAYFKKIRAELADVQAAIPEAIMNHPPKWKRFDKAECTQCGWKGHEGEMRRKHTIMGDGTYPAGCPKCTAENVFLGPVLVKRGGGHVVVPSNSEGKG